MLSLNANGINGILADEMGLGKTIEMLSLVHSHKSPEHDAALAGVDRAADLGWLSFYPWEEAELVLPALSYLELLGQKVDGERLGVRVAHRAPNFALP